MVKIRMPDPYPNSPEQLCRVVTRAQEALDEHERAVADALAARPPSLPDRKTALELELDRNTEYFVSRVMYYAR